MKPGAILAIDTSTPRGSLAVLAGDEVRYEHHFSSDRSHNSQLFAPLCEALEACREDLSLIVVGTGPASYTGVRIGIAAAQGIAMSRGVQVIGLPSLLAADVEPGLPAFLMCGDARRGSFFAAEIHAGTADAPLRMFDAPELQALRQSSTTGSLPWFTFDTKSPLGLPGVATVHPSAIRLASCAALLSDSKLATLSALPLEPVYLASAFVTQPKKPGKGGT